MKRPDGLLDKPQQVSCTLCGKIPERDDSCGLTHVKLKGKSYERIKNDDKDYCGDCGVGADKYHHDGCDLERCPRCKEQAIGCGCPFTKKELEYNEKHGMSLEQASKMLEYSYKIQGLPEFEKNLAELKKNGKKHGFGSRCREIPRSAES